MSSCYRAITWVCSIVHNNYLTSFLCHVAGCMSHVCICVMLPEWGDETEEVHFQLLLQMRKLVHVPSFQSAWLELIFLLPWTISIIWKEYFEIWHNRFESHAQHSHPFIVDVVAIEVGIQSETNLDRVSEEVTATHRHHEQSKEMYERVVADQVANEEQTLTKFLALLNEKKAKIGQLKIHWVKREVIKSNAQTFDQFQLV